MFPKHKTLFIKIRWRHSGKQTQMVFHYREWFLWTNVKNCFCTNFCKKLILKKLNFLRQKACINKQNCNCLSQWQRLIGQSVKWRLLLKCKLQQNAKKCLVKQQNVHCCANHQLWRVSPNQGQVVEMLAAVANLNKQSILVTQKRHDKPWIREIDRIKACKSVQNCANSIVIIKSNDCLD